MQLSELHAAANRTIDKLRTTVISLSGGALGSTIIFLKEIIGLGNECALDMVKIAWVLWLFSIVVTLFSYFCQYQGLLLRIKGENESVRYTATEKWEIAMGYSYLAGTTAFITGVVTVAIAVLSNV
jgi:hypothetical protein